MSVPVVFSFRTEYDVTFMPKSVLLALLSSKSVLLVSQSLSFSDETQEF